MSPDLLTALVILPTAVVVVALCYVMWRRRSSARTEAVAILAGAALALWAALTAVLASAGFYRPPDTNSAPTVGIQLAIVLTVLAVALAASPSLRSLLTDQRHLIRLNVWRLEGLVFLALMFAGQVPALWALPAGLGDVIVGATAFSVGSRLDEPGGARLAVAFNIFGLADLVVAVGLGVTTNPGPAQLFHTTPTSELVTRFPLALVPGFLVPLAAMLHIASLWQLSGRPWVRPVGGR